MIHEFHNHPFARLEPTSPLGLSHTVPTTPCGICWMACDLFGPIKRRLKQKDYCGVTMVDGCTSNRNPVS